MLKRYHYAPKWKVQASNKEEAKIRIEARLKTILLHPDGINSKEIELIQLA